LAPKIEPDLPLAGFEAEINMAEQLPLSLAASLGFSWALPRRLKIAEGTAIP
jgi:electron transfer flavoprotein alpha/beta subunit